METPPDGNYSGTSVLVNKLRLRDQAELSGVEDRLVANRLRSLKVPAGDLEQPGSVSKIHAHLFQDVYAWAGQHRHVQVFKGQQFLPAELVSTALDDAFARFREALPERDRIAIAGIAGTDPRLAGAALAERLARTVGDVNYIHPFREGNGRTTRAFIGEVAASAGLRFDSARLDRAQWIQASIESTENIRNLNRMEAQLRGALVQPPRERVLEAAATQPQRGPRSRGERGLRRDEELER